MAARRNRRSVLSLCCAALGAAQLLAGAPATAGPAPARARLAARVTAAATRSAVVAAAARYGRSRGYHVGVAVLDRVTGAIYGGGDDTGAFASESVVKVFIATRLLVSGQMHGQTAAMAYKMITQSDDDMATALYGRVGGDSLITWVKRRYRLPGLGSPPQHAGWWGNTHITPAGLVRLYAKLAADPRVAGWLLDAMHHARPYGSDGTYQFFGLPSATAHPAVKQGWGCDFTGSCLEADFNSTGYVDGNRYAVAMLARGPIGSYGRSIASMLTGMARTLLPRGQFPPPPPVVLTLGRSKTSTAGNSSLWVTGRDFIGVHRVLVGGRPAPAVSTVSPRRLRITLPSHPAGAVPVRVVTASGMSPLRGAPLLRYVAPPMTSRVGRRYLAAAGGTTITVFGSGFLDVRRVLIGGTPATGVRVASEQRLTAVAAAHAPGPAAVTVISRFGRGHPLAAAVEFVPAPVITGIAPTSVADTGGRVTISGSSFRHVREVLFGRQPGTGLSVSSPTSLTVSAPAHTAGRVPVRVVSEFGRSQPGELSYVASLQRTTGGV